MQITCESSTTQPALIYFPAGTYIVSAPIVAMYYSQLIGDPLNRPVIKADPTFKGLALVDSDPYGDFGENWYKNQVSDFLLLITIAISTDLVRTIFSGLSEISSWTQRRCPLRQRG